MQKASNLNSHTVVIRLMPFFIFEAMIGRTILTATLLLAGWFTYAGEHLLPAPEAATVHPTDTVGQVIIMNKALFIRDVCDYEHSTEWKYKGNRPAIIDLYADWCGPCRRVAPIMNELAAEYAGKIVIYKVNVDKERELASLFGASSIPLFVFIPMDEAPQLFRGAADKATYKRIIDEFLLKLPPAEAQ